MPTASTASNKAQGFIGAIVSEQFPDLLDTSFQKVYSRTWKREIQGLSHFKQESTSRNSVKESTITGLGLMQRSDDEDNLPLDTPLPGFDNEVTPLDYRLSIRITERMRETDQWGQIGKLQSMLARSPLDSIEYHSADVFNTGFDSTGQFLAGDGMYLFDDERPFEDASLGNWSNLESASALTPTSFETARLNFRSTLNERGLLRPLTAAKLIVPPALEKTARTIFESTGSTGNNHNDINFHKGQVQIDVWDYLTDTNAWFVCAPMDELFELKWYWRVKPNFKGNALSDNPDVYMQRARMSFAAGCLRPHSLRGNVGA